MHSEPYDRFWAAYLGVTTTELNTAGTSIAEHVGLQGYSGVWFFRRKRRWVVSAPADVVPHIRSRIDSFDAAHFAATHFYEELFGERFERIVGPAFQGYLSRAETRSGTLAKIEMLVSHASSVVETFRLACNPEDWASSGLAEARQYLAVARDDGDVVAMAGYRPWTDVAGDVCVLTRADRRGKGFATAAARAVVGRASQAGKLLLYQTLESNAAAIGVSRRLGYEPYARHVAVRLKGGAAS